MAEVGGTSQTPQRSVGRTIARNTIFGIGSQFALKLVNFFFNNILIVHTLGTAKFGQYSIVLYWAGLFGVLGDLGVTMYYTREIARNPKKADELFWDAVSLRFILAIIASVVTVVTAIGIMGYPHDIILGLIIFTVAYLFQSVMAPMNSVLTGNERIDILSIFTVLIQILSSLGTFIVLMLNLNYVWLFTPQYVVFPIVIALQIWIIRRNKMGPPRFHINPRMWLSVIRAGLPFAAIQVSLTFALHFDTIVLSRHVTDSEIGLYNIAYNLVLILVNIAQSFSNAILPTLAREYASRPDSVKPWYYVSTRMMVFISLPIAIGMTALARQIITLLYQPEVLPAFITLAILAWDMPFVMYHNFCSNIAQSVQKENRAAWVAISLGVFNLLLNLLLVPQLGIIGSSFATVLTDFLGAAQYYLILRHAFGAGLGFNRLIRIVASAVLMGVLVFILHDANILVVAAVGGIFYLVIIWFSGAFSPEERARLVSMVSRRLPLRPRTA